MWFIHRSKRSRRAERLKQDFDQIVDLCARSRKLSYSILSKDGQYPDGYRVYYHVKSITGIRPSGEPIYGDRHAAVIRLPASYPVHQPVCYMETDLWHPNIRYSGKLKGHICINEDKLGAWHTLDMLVIRIGHMLQYKNYHALMRPPWPEDPEVARWVREYAEPQGVVNKFEKKYVDDEPLFDPSREWLATRARPEEGSLPETPRILVRSRETASPGSGSRGDAATSNESKRTWPSFLRSAPPKANPRIVIRREDP